jgi:hypothetical protein
MKCPSESNDTVRIDKSQRNATPRKTVKMVQRSLFRIGVAAPLCEFRVKERNPPKDGDNENEKTNAILP